uniref:Sushi domain-containing protein n=1 Tax=Varanus komodoensis TaxID=61221 RepID=A0A8D2PZW7_VARKO
MEGSRRRDFPADLKGRSGIYGRKRSFSFTTNTDLTFPHFFLLTEGSCGPPVRLDFAELHNDAYKEKNSFPIGSVVKYTCRPGYVKHPGMKASLTCLRNQVWSEVQEFCKSESLNI